MLEYNIKSTYKFIIYALSTSLIVIAIFLFFPLNILAQDSTSASNSSVSSQITSQQERYVEVSTKKLVQDVYDGTVSIDVEIKSLVDSDRLQINANYDKNKFQLMNYYDNFFSSIKKNTVKNLKFKFKPLVAGDVNVIFKVQAWKNDSNYIALEEVNYIFDNNLLSIPVTQEYNANLRTYNTLKIVGVIVLAIFVILIGYYGFAKYKQWYQED